MYKLQVLQAIAIESNTGTKKLVASIHLQDLYLKLLDVPPPAKSLTLKHPSISNSYLHRSSCTINKNLMELSFPSRHGAHQFHQGNHFWSLTKPLTTPTFPHFSKSFPNFRDGQIICFWGLKSSMATPFFWSSKKGYKWGKIRWMHRHLPGDGCFICLLHLMSV